MGLTQIHLGKMLGYGSTAIANYESGRNEPSLNDLCRIADYLEVSTDYLLGRTEDKRIPHTFSAYQQVSFADVLEVTEKAFSKNRK